MISRTGRARRLDRDGWDRRARPSTNIAILKPAEPIASPAIAVAEARTGAMALAVGADGTGGASARLGLVNLAGPEWHSSRGGLIDRRIVLDVRLARREEGGPVFDAAGGCLGMSTFGPRGQVIVIPAATLERVVPQLARDGRIARGWLGVGCRLSRCPTRCATPPISPVA
jgi:S1-C subfamily serine protease